MSFSVETWMAEDTFDPVIYPMGEMSKLTSSVPLMELLLEPDGFKVRESLSPDVSYVYPTCPEGMSYQKQWSILYENILDWDLKDDTKLQNMMTLVAKMTLFMVTAKLSIVILRICCRKIIQKLFKNQFLIVCSATILIL